MAHKRLREGWSWLAGRELIDRDMIFPAVPLPLPCGHLLPHWLSLIPCAPLCLFTSHMSSGGLGTSSDPKS